MNTEKKRSPRSPILPQPDSKSPGSVSQKTPTTLSRQGTLRASHRRKNSMTGSLILSQGRRSPVGAFMEQRSPQGRRSPIFLTHDHLRSPNEFPIGHFEAKSPTMERKSPTDRRSPTFSIHTQDRLSPIGMFESQRRSPTSTVHVQEGQFIDLDHTPDETSRTPTGLLPIKRTSISLFTPIPFGEKRSPVTNMPIPPITVSNPSETCKIVEKIMAESKSPIETPKEIEKPSEQGKEKDKEEKKEKDSKEEKKEKTSVMKEILAFVRKPSKRVTTRTGRFAAAFSRAESGSSGAPLLRQSTFSASPAAASTAAKSAVTKQMSEVGFESKMSLRFSLSNTKMSLKLRRSAIDDKAKKEKRLSGDETAGTTTTTIMEVDSKSPVVAEKEEQVGKKAPFELANVHFEKVGESYIKHEQIREEPSEEGSPSQIVALSNENAQKVTESVLKECNDTDTVIGKEIDQAKSKSSNDSIDTPIKEIEQMKQENIDQKVSPVKPEPIYQNLIELRAGIDEKAASSSIPLQCPTFEIEPPSRRSSFDPPRSPYLENLRSPGVDTDTELMNLNRGDSGGDSFEIVDTDRNRESSFEDRYSSRDTSFDISRYQSTSYEDQTSSFEIIDIDKAEEKKSNIDLRKSSIELVDAETFARSGSSGRKSSLETHFDYTPQDTPSTSKSSFPTTKKHKSSRDFHILQYISRARSPISNQTSSNYSSSRDSYDSSSSYPHSHHTSTEQKSPFADPSKQHFPLTLKGQSEELRTFLCTDPKCASIFEPRNSLVSSTSSRVLPPTISGLSQGTLSGSEFEPPSPRRAASASPKHTFTFRIVLKKVDSSPDAICPSAERRSRERFDKHKRRDSRKKRLGDAGKSF